MKTLSAFFVILLLIFVSYGQKSQPKAKNFTARSLDGKTFELDQLKGKVVLVAFWSTRCAICAAEVPKLNKLAETYKDKNVVFLGLAAENESDIKKYLRKKTFEFNLLPNTFGVLLQFAEKDSDGNLLMGYPAYFLIDQEGKIELAAKGYNKTGLIGSNIKKLLTAELN